MGTLTLILAESSSPARKNVRKSCRHSFSGKQKHMVLKCSRDPMFLEEAAEAIWCLVNVYMYWLPIEVH